MRSLLFILMAALCWGISPLLEKVALSKGDATAGLMCRTWAVAICLLVLGAATGQWKAVGQLDGRTILLFALSGIVSAMVGQWLYYHALKGAEASRIVPIGATYPLVAAALGILFLKEPITLPKLLGAVLIFCGVVLVKS
ncbi:MAG: EamA family transporter [Armatimonadetes bacterium]|nr:EamA family transporter [Armatimonadota bacterium]